MRDRTKSIVLFLAIIFLVSLGGYLSAEKNFKSTDGHPEKREPQSLLRPPFAWPQSSPEAQGLDTSIFVKARAEAQKLSHLHSFLVIRNGFLISEWYAPGRFADYAGHIQSITKSVLSCLTGLAFRENHLFSLDQKMMDFFPEYDHPGLDPRKYDITIQHLLTMRAGFDHDDVPEDNQEYFSSPDWIQYAIDLPLRDNPGERFNYSNPQANLLAVIIARASGKNLREFAEEHLFGPLNISVRNWSQDPDGNYLGSMGLYLTPRDMARFGYLYLKNGQIDGQQILPSAWIEETLKRRYPELGYGYLWWLITIVGFEGYDAMGYGGQLIMNIPELDMVIVTTADPNPEWERVNENEFTILKLLGFHLLVPIADWLGPPPHAPVNASVQRIENRGLVVSEPMNVLKWMPNPRNSGVNITGYKIYLFDLNTLALVPLQDVNADTLEYWHRPVDRNEEYIYAISTVSNGGAESWAVVVELGY
jgi:CubicO group peptidase (beta-lactamase class C family)